MLTGKAAVPQRGSATFVSAIGHLDKRVDLLKFDAASLRSEEESEEVAACSQVGRRAVMDLCMMASKLAYENDKVVADVVNNHWKAMSPPRLLKQSLLLHACQLIVVISSTVLFNHEL